MDPIPALDGKTVTGGRLDAARALTGVLPPDTSGPRVTATDPQGATVGPVSSLRVTFNEAIDPTSFTLDDISSFIGPDGAIAVTGIQPVGTTNVRAFDLTFASQSTLGDYDMILGPNINDLAGNPMNQDRDAQNGEPIDDQFHAHFTLSDQLTYAATDVPQFIDYYWSATSSVTVDQDVTIGDLNVTLNITHPFVGDLALSLIGPDGTSITLSAFNGDGANFSDTTFDDQASIGIGAGSAPSPAPTSPTSRSRRSTARTRLARGPWRWTTGASRRAG